MTELNRIKAILVEKHRTGKWLGEQLSISNCSVSKWLNNHVQPDLRTLYQIADLLDVDVKDLLVSNKQNIMQNFA